MQPSNHPGDQGLPQWSLSLNGRYWSAKGGTLVVEGRQKHRANWYTMFSTARIFYGVTNGRPLCIYSATTAMRVPSSCLPWAIWERPTSSATFVRPNMLKTSRRVWRPWRGLNILCATLERPRQTFSLLCAVNGDLDSFVVAQGKHKSRGPFVRPPLHRAATIEPPLSDVKNDQDAHRSPKPRSPCFCVTAAARPLCLPRTTKTVV